MRRIALRAVVGVTVAFGAARLVRWAVWAILVLLVAPVASASAKNFQVVVFGDSYGSGEGAPATNGDYGADGGALRNQGVLGIINEGSRPLPNPAADWNGNAADSEFTGDGPTAARRCHRSPRATAPRAVRLLAAEFPDVDFTFRSFACSGARIDEGPIGSYEGAQPIDQTRPTGCRLRSPRPTPTSPIRRRASPTASTRS